MRTARHWLFFVFGLLLPLAIAAAPDIVLQDLSGKPRNVKEFIGNGKWTVVSVWSADCPICRRDIYHMTFFHEEHKNKDAQVLGISVDDDRKKAQGFVDDQGLNFPNLVGGPNDASRLGNGRFIGTPTYHFFAPDGRYMTTRVGSLTQTQAEEIITQLKAQAAPAGKRG